MWCGSTPHIRYHISRPVNTTDEHLNYSARLRQRLCSILRGELRIARARNSPRNIKQNCWREEKGKEVNYKISMRIMRSIKAIISSSDSLQLPFAKMLALRHVVRKRVNKTLI